MNSGEQFDSLPTEESSRCVESGLSRELAICDYQFKSVAEELACLQEETSIGQELASFCIVPGVRGSALAIEGARWLQIYAHEGGRRSFHAAGGQEATSRQVKLTAARLMTLSASLTNRLSFFLRQYTGVTTEAARQESLQVVCAAVKQAIAKSPCAYEDYLRIRPFKETPMGENLKSIHDLIRQQQLQTGAYQQSVSCNPDIAKQALPLAAEAAATSFHIARAWIAKDDRFDILRSID